MREPAASAPPIRFGTSGWRGVLADEITAPRLDTFAAAVGRFAKRLRREPRILVAHDTRFLGALLAARVRAGLRAVGTTPVPVASPCPTPVVARAVRNGDGDVGVVVTASHNAPGYQGLKVIVSGGGIGAEEARRIEVVAAQERPRRRSPAAPPATEPAPTDLVEPYLEALAAALDGGPARAGPRRTRAGPTVVYDALHGAGSGVCDRALRGLGLRVAVLHGTRGPRFGGEAPDPTPERLAALGSAVRARRGRAIGLATDGDADRYAVTDEVGRPLRETEALALLIDHLAATGRVRRGVAVSIATGSWVEGVAASHGLAVTRHPIGFKHLTRELASGRADVAGEESGGFAWDPVARDKDGILACALFAELAAASAVSLRARVRALARRFGRRVCERRALPASPAARERLAAWIAAPPDGVEGARVRSVDVRDGLRLGFDDGFLMLRASGTEPVLRLYAEAPDPRALARRFAAGEALLAGPCAAMDAPRPPG